MSDKIKVFLGNIFLYSFLAWTTWGTVSVAVKTVPPLSTEQAFVFSAAVNQSNIIETKWHIAPGYYLYRDKFDFKVAPDVKVEAAYPKTILKYDGKKGQRAVYAGDIVIPLTVTTDAKNVNLTVQYQGCSKGGFCYPPVQKTIQVSFNGATPSAGAISFNNLLTNQNNIVSLFHTQHIFMVMLIFLGHSGGR